MPIQSKNKHFDHTDAQRDAQLLSVIRELRTEITETLAQEEARRLNASLGQHLSRAKQPALREEAIRKAVDRIDEYPLIRERFSEKLDQKVRWYSRPLSGDLFSLAGDLFDIEPGLLMVCPLDPQHYQRYRRNANQELRCPHHDLKLVPAPETDQPLKK